MVERRSRDATEKRSVSVLSIIWLQPLPRGRWRRVSRKGYKHITVPLCFNKICMCQSDTATSPNQVLALLAPADQTLVSSELSDSY